MKHATATTSTKPIVTAPKNNTTEDTKKLFVTVSYYAPPKIRQSQLNLLRASRTQEDIVAAL